MAYIVVNDARRQESEEIELEAAVRMAESEHAERAEPLRVVRAETGHTVLYIGHSGYRCVNRAMANRKADAGASHQLDGGFSRPSDSLEAAIANAAMEYLRCARRGQKAVIEVVDGAGKVYWRNGRPLSTS